jgi:hypothetical protein
VTSEPFNKLIHSDVTTPEYDNLDNNKWRRKNLLIAG